jgi:hypothetical protein
MKKSGYTLLIYVCIAIYFGPEKNHELLLFDAEFSLCRPESTGFGASPPPPLNGLAIRLPAPPKLNPPDPVGEPNPRVLPIFAASRRSLTALSCASNLEGIIRI